MQEIKEFKSEGTEIYKILDIVNSYIEAEVEFSFFFIRKSIFINLSVNFSKFTLLHYYIILTCMYYYGKDFRDMDDNIELPYWENLFSKYNIKYLKYIEGENAEDEETMLEWFRKNENPFNELFNYLAEEVFYILFNNKQCLLKFNNLISKTIKETKFPKKYLNTKGRIKRTSIPQWVKKAVYHRDKGRCIFCKTDLTGLINSLTNINYDHIVPLELYGVNDPCNIQLSCEKCNKSKKDLKIITSNHYFPWW